MRAQVNTDCDNLDVTGAWKAGFGYDPLGRLYKINKGLNSTRLLHDGDALVAEYDDGNDTMLRRYVHGANAAADDPLVWYEGAGVARADRRYLYADARGSIVLVADADGNTQAINAYDEYGIPTTDNGGFDITTRGRFRYTGQLWLPELGMYYYKARVYSPTLGRFMQTDPIGYEDQFNLYAYVANDPINGVDFSGLRRDPLAQYKIARAARARGQRATVSTGSQRSAASVSATGATVAGAAATGATKAPARVTVDSRGTVRTGGPQGQPFRGNQHVRATSVASVGSTAARVATPVAVGLDATAQVQDGKPVDQALVNAGSRGGFAVAVGSIAAAAAPETLGGSLVVAGAVLGADALLGGAVGEAAENAYINATSGSTSSEPPKTGIERDDFCRAC